MDYGEDTMDFLYLVTDVDLPRKACDSRYCAEDMSYPTLKFPAATLDQCPLLAQVL